MKKKIKKYIDSLGQIDGKKVIITGANSGIGFELSKIVVSKGGSLVVACRNEAKVQKAINEILEKFPNAKIDYIIYDQSDLFSVKKLSNEILNNHKDFYAMVLNAGVLKPKKDAKTKDGFPLTSGVNFFGNLYLIELLQPYFEEVEFEKKIIIQSSISIYYGKYESMEKSLLNFNMRGMQQYENSKLAEANIFYHFGTNKKNENVKYLLADPGSCDTGILRNYPKVIVPLAHFFVRHVFQDSCAGALSCATLICNETKNLDYYKPRHLFGLRGLPKKVSFKQKLIRKNIIHDAETLLNGRNI